MSNTMKVISKQGEIYIGQQEHKRYKNLELFGYGYIDWGRVINQSLVTLYDLIDSIQDGGAADIEFDLNNYEEGQKVLRNQEFTIWKNEFKSLLTTEVEAYKEQVNLTLQNYNVTIQQIQEFTTTSISENYDEINEKISGIYTQVETVINEQIQINIRSLIEKINQANQAVTDATQQLSTATSTINSVVQEVNQVILNFKQSFEQSFNVFKLEIEGTMTSYKDILIKYIDDKIITVSSATGDMDTRIQKIEADLSKVNLSNLETFITNTITTNISGIINSNVTQLNRSIDLLAAEIIDLEGDLNQKITEITENINSGLNQRFEQITNNISTINKGIEDLKTSGENARVKVDSFLMETKRFLSTPDYIAENIVHLKALTLSNTSEENINIKIIKLMEQIITQNENNIKNLKAYIDSERNNLLNSLRETEFDELAMLNTRTEEKTLIDNKHSLRVENLHGTKFGLNDLLLIGPKRLFQVEDGSVSQIIFTLDIPQDIFPEMYDGAELRVSIDNRVPYGKTRNYYRTIMIKVPRVNNMLSKEGAILKPGLYPNMNTIDDIENFIDYNFIGDVWYSQNGLTTLPIALVVANENLKITTFENMQIYFTIIGKTKTYNFSFKIADIYNSTKPSFIYNLIENKNNYSTAIQDIINNKIIPNYDFTKNVLMDNYGVSLPVCEIQSQIKNGLETKLFRIKVNLPTGATLSNITYKVGTENDILKAFGNVKYSPNYTTYLANKAANSNNDLYFTDLQTTGVLKIPITSSASSITGTVNYKIGSITKTISFSI